MRTTDSLPLRQGGAEIGIFKDRKAARISAPVAQNRGRHIFGMLDDYVPLGAPQTRLYYALREAVPIIDAAVFKIVRLVGGFTVECGDKAAQRELRAFIEDVPVGGNRMGMSAFISSYLEQLLTCGTAVGEIITDTEGTPRALFNTPPDYITLKRSHSPF